jgi:hypothetical protein
MIPLRRTLITVLFLLFLPTLSRAAPSPCTYANASFSHGAIRLEGNLCKACANGLWTAADPAACNTCAPPKANDKAPTPTPSTKRADSSCVYGAEGDFAEGATRNNAGGCQVCRFGEWLNTPCKDCGLDPAAPASK